MQAKKHLLYRLLNRKRVGVSPKNYLKKLRFISLFFLFVVISLSVINAYINGLTYLGILTSGAALILVLGAGCYFQCYAKSTAVKGDNLIINSLSNPSCVTSLRSVRNVRTKSFLGIQWTNLNYNLDGITKKVVILNRATSVTVPPEMAIKKAIRLSKKQKANHKPDPVTVN